MRDMPKRGAFAHKLDRKNESMQNLIARSKAVTQVLDQIEKVEKMPVAFLDLHLMHPTVEGHAIFINGHITPEGKMLLILDEKKFNAVTGDNDDLRKGILHAEVFSAWLVDKQAAGWKFYHE